MGGEGGFFGGVAQGIQAAREEAQFRERLTLEKQRLGLEEKRFKTEDQIKALQLKSLQDKILAQGRLPGLEAQALAPQGGPAKTIGMQPLQSLIQAADLAGKDIMPYLQTLALTNPALAKHLKSQERRKPEFMKLGAEESIVQLPEEDAQPSPQPPATQAAKPPEGAAQLTGAGGMPSTPAEAAPTPRVSGGAKVIAQGQPKQEKEEKLVNPVDQRVAVLSQGKFMTLKDAIKGGQHALAAQAEEEVRLSRPVAIAGAAAGAKEEVKGKFEVRQKLADLDNVNVLIDEIDGLSEGLIVAETGIEAIGQGARLRIGALTRSNDAAKAYDDQRAAFLGVISRQLGGERGVLTDRDIKRIDAALPEFSDTKRVRDFKVASMRLIIATAIDAKKRGLSGEPPDPQLKKQLQQLFKTLEVGLKSATGFSPDEKQYYEEIYRKKLEELQQKAGKGKRAK